MPRERCYRVTFFSIVCSRWRKTNSRKKLRKSKLINAEYYFLPVLPNGVLQTGAPLLVFPVSLSDHR